MLSGVGRQGDVGKVMPEIFEVSGNAHHGGIVGAELERRDEDLQTAPLPQALDFAAQKAVGRNTASYGHLLDTSLFDGLLDLLDQESDDALLYGGTEVGFVVLYKCRVFGKPVAQEIEERCFDSAEAVVVAGYDWGGEMEGVGVALLGQPVYHRAARVAKVHDFGCLVDGFACRIVDSLTQHLDVEMTAEEENLCVSARDQQTDKRELRDGAVVVFFDEMRQDMRLEVVHLDKGNGECLGKAFGKGDTHHERTEQSRPTGEGHGIDLRLVNPGIAYGGIHYRHDVLLVGARSQLGNHTAVLFMHLLRGNDVGQDAVAPQEGCGGVVARRLDGEY